MMFVAWLVLPLASAVTKQFVPRPNGRLLMNGLIFTWLTFRPSSARIFTVLDVQTQNSRPSPGILLYIPTCRAERRVLFPWNPPPTMRVMPLRKPMPARVFFMLGKSKVTRSVSGDRNGTNGCVESPTPMSAFLSFIGLSSAPLFRGNIAPLGTNATNPRISKQDRTHS